MKNYSLSLLIFFCAGLLLNLSAQEPGGSDSPGRSPQCMMQCLNLDSEQENSLEEMREEFEKQCREIRTDSSLTPMERRERLSILREQHREEMMGVLTEDQKQDFHSCCPGPRSVRHDRMRARNEIPPMLIQKRSDFEKALNDDEKRIIENLREEFKSHRMQMHESIRERNRVMPEERAEIRKQMQEKFQGLDPIISNHRAELDAILQEMDANRSGFRRPGEGFHKRPGHGRERGDILLRERHFLLLDPERGSPELNNLDQEPQGLHLYPNPAKNSLNIEFETEIDGWVTIDLLDNSGTEIKQVDRSNRKAGHHSFTLDVSELQTGDIHYVRISLDGRTQVKKFVKI